MHLSHIPIFVHLIVELTCHEKKAFDKSPFTHIDLWKVIFGKIFETFVTWSFLIFFNTFTSKSHFFLHPCCRKSKNWKKFRIFWPKLSHDKGLMLLYINVKYQNASLHKIQIPAKKKDGSFETHLILIILFLSFFQKCHKISQIF